MNVAKRKVMRVHRNGNPGGAEMVLNDETQEQVAKFHHLGGNTNTLRFMEAEISHRSRKGEKFLGLREIRALSVEAEI